MSKIKVKLIGENGNIFNLVGIVSKELKKHGKKKECEEMAEKVYQAGSYEEALTIIGEYVDIV